LSVTHSRTANQGADKIVHHGLYDIRHLVGVMCGGWSHTRSGERLPVTLVLGLSCANSSRRLGGSFLSQSSNSSASEWIADNETLYPAGEGYNSCKTLFKILDAENRARAPETRVGSSDGVGMSPVSVMFSSSTSAGYSVQISASEIRTGSPVRAAANLVKFPRQHN
jgi:hypothetical protein